MLISLLLAGLHANAGEETEQLSPRAGVTLNFSLIVPANPVASVILFPGGNGKIGISSYGIENEGNFLVRTRDMFADRDMIVAVVDAPSDRQGQKGMLSGFRTSSEHLTDIDAVIDYLQKKAAVPVWLIGTSRGTESAAHVAIHTNRKIGGVVLTASVTESNSKGTAVTKMNLGKIQAPVLIASHKKDECHVTPPRGAKKIKAALTSAQVAEIKFYTGGSKPESKPCKARSPHGFFGIEEAVVGDIVQFIKGHQRVSPSLPG